jgi:hypothetical protein
MTAVICFSSRSKARGRGPKGQDSVKKESRHRLQVDLTASTLCRDYYSSRLALLHPKMFRPGMGMLWDPFSKKSGPRCSGIMGRGKLATLRSQIADLFRVGQGSMVRVLVSQSSMVWSPLNTQAHGSMGWGPCRWRWE